MTHSLIFPFIVLNVVKGDSMQTSTTDYFFKLSLDIFYSQILKLEALKFFFLYVEHMLCAASSNGDL